MALQKFSQDFLDGRLHSYGDVLVVVPKSVTRATRTAQRNIRFETDRPSQMTVSRSFKLCMLIWRRKMCRRPKGESALMVSLSRARRPHAICRRGTVDPVGHLGNVN